MRAAWNADNFLILKDGNDTILWFSGSSDFANIAPHVGEYEIDSYTDNEITITHTDPALSGTYDLGNNPTLLAQATPALTDIKEVFDDILTSAYTNVVSQARQPIEETTRVTPENVKKFGKAMWDIIQLAQEG